MKTFATIAMLCFFFGCGGGGGSGGGSPVGKDGTTTTVTPATTTTTTQRPRTMAEKVEGSWSYNAGSFSGSLVFHSGRASVTSSAHQVVGSHTFLETGLDVKITANCNNGSQLKFAMNFNGDRTLAGWVDYHPDPENNYSQYTRYNVSANHR